MGRYSLADVAYLLVSLHSTVVALCLLVVENYQQVGWLGLSSSDLSDGGKKHLISVI